MDDDQLKNQLISFIVEELLDDDEQEIDDSTSLFESGLLDSMSLSSLILHIEQTAGARIGPLDISYETFDSVERMVRLIRAKSQS